MEETEVRPKPFPAGMPVGLHLTLEGLLSMGPGRTYYLAHNREPRWYTRICWNCGHKHNPTSAQACVYCQQPLSERRFLLSCRWAADQVQPFHRFAAARLRHHAIHAPIVLYQYREQLLAFHEIGDEAMLLDEPAPLRPRTVLAAAWTLAAGLIELHAHGFTTRRLGPEHVLVGRDGARLWDLELNRPSSRPIERGSDLAHAAGRQVGELLLPYTPADQREICTFLGEAAAGRFEDVTGFQRELRKFARDLRVDASERRVAALSSVGRRRPANEDAWAVRRVPSRPGGGPESEVDVLVVADGMGGYSAGEAASAAAVDASLRAVAQLLPRAERNRDAQEEVVREAIEAANRAVRTLVDDADGRPCGTTIVLAVLRPDGTAVIGHVGDSRAYRWRAGELLPLTEDHSMVAAMVAAGKLDREGARVHPRSNVLLRYLGNTSEADPDLTTVALQPGDRLLLCTDGVWGELPEASIAARIDAAVDARRTARALVAAANEAGGRDNATALVARV